MKKCKVENLIAIAAILGVLLLFGVFMFDGASKMLAVCAAVLAVIGVAVAFFGKGVRKLQVTLSTIGVCICCVILGCALATQTYAFNTVTFKMCDEIVIEMVQREFYRLV